MEFRISKKAQRMLLAFTFLFIGFGWLGFLGLISTLLGYAITFETVLFSLSPTFQVQLFHPLSLILIFFGIQIIRGKLI